MFATIISTAIIIAIILAIAATSGFISERAGIVNIAIEGFLTFGALIYSILRGTLSVDGWNQIPALLIAMLATSAFSVLHSIICIQLKANQVISGTAINLLAAGLTLFLIKVVFKQSDSSLDSQFAHIGPSKDLLGGWWWFNLLNIIAIISIVIIWLIMRYTRLGMRLIASGENPNALASQGVSVVKTRYIAIFMSGAIAGMGGALFAQSQSSFFGTANGLGFIALAILICGQWRIPLLVIASIIFGVLESLANNSSTMTGWISDNVDFIQMLPFALALAALVITSKTSRSPKTVGIPYEKGQR